MATEPRFTYTNDNFYVVAPGNIITVKTQILKYVNLLLNSKLIYFSLKSFYMGGGINGELKTNNLERLPIPQIPADKMSEFENLANELLNLNENLKTTKMLF